MNIHAAINSFFLEALGYVKPMSGGYAVFSESGKKLSRVYKTKAEAVERLRQIEYFKNKKKTSKAFDLRYSEIVRNLRKDNPDKAKKFQTIFKKYFDLESKNNSNDKDLEQKSLIKTLEEFEID